MEVSVARKIITQARKDEIYQGGMPEDDATCISEAEALVTMAEQAWTQNTRGPEVQAILNIANGGTPPSENGSGSEVPSPEPEVTAESDDSSSEKVDLSHFPESLATTEPWEDYAEATVADATEGLNWYIEELKDSPSELGDLVLNVYVFESAHKRRSRILKNAVEVLNRLNISVEPQQPEQPAEETEPTPDEVPEAKAEQPVEKAPEKDEPQQHDESDDTPYHRLLENVEAELRRERLDGIPKPPQEQAPEIPWNWNDVSDADLRNMHTQFAALRYYKSYQLARDERIALLCKEAADEMRNRLMIEISKYDEKNKEKKVAVIEAEIESSQHVRVWRKLQRKHEQFALQHRREMESYEKLVESLSRLETMRHNSYERSRR